MLKVKHYHRYADDMVFLTSTKEELWYIFNKVKQYIHTLKVNIKPNYRVFPVDKTGIDFVGYVFRHNYVLLRTSIKNKINTLIWLHNNNKVRFTKFDERKLHIELVEVR